MARKKKTGGALSGGVWEFSKTYPMLADAVLIYEEFDFSGLVRAGVHSLRRHGHVLECANSRCQKGGYNLRPDIELMMAMLPKQTRAINLQCEGCETRPKRSQGNSCTGCIEGTLELHLKKAASPRDKKVPHPA
jgi:hypothetical protein